MGALDPVWRPLVHCKRDQPSEDLLTSLPAQLGVSTEDLTTLQLSFILLFVRSSILNFQIAIDTAIFAEGTSSGRAPLGSPECKEVVLDFRRSRFFVPARLHNKHSFW